MIKPLIITEVNDGFQTRFDAEEHTYPLQVRWQKVKELAKKIFSDICTLFTQETWNQIKIIFTAREIIKKDRHSILEIHDDVHLKPISFEHPYKEIEKNNFDIEKAKSEIKSPTYLHLAYHIENITYDQLFAGLNGCIEKFKELIGDRPYQVGILANKSQGWLAKIAQNYFGLKFESAFGLFSDHAADIQATAIKHPATDLVIFDDISYSGNQVYEVVKRLIQNQAKAAFQEKPVNVYVIIPFMTLHAKNQLKSIQELAGQNVSVHLITTYKHLPIVREIIPNSGSIGGVEPTNALCVPEWKMPDGASFPITFKDFCKKDIIPPYKKG